MSSKRREICPPELIFQNFKFTEVQNLVDFGAGLGFYITEFRKILPKDSWIWPCECQHDLIDQILKRKIEENIPNMTPFFMDRSDHPLLPEWIPILIEFFPSSAFHFSKPWTCYGWFDSFNESRWSFSSC